MSSAVGTKGVERLKEEFHFADVLDQKLSDLGFGHWLQFAVTSTIYLPNFYFIFIFPLTVKRPLAKTADMHFHLRKIVLAKTPSLNPNLQYC